MPTDLLDLSPFFLNRTRQIGYLQYDAYAYRVNVYSYLRRKLMHLDCRFCIPLIYS